MASVGVTVCLLLVTMVMKTLYRLALPSPRELHGDTKKQVSGTVGRVNRETKIPEIESTHQVLPRGTQPARPS